MGMGKVGGEVIKTSLKFGCGKFCATNSSIFSPVYFCLKASPRTQGVYQAPPPPQLDIPTQYSWFCLFVIKYWNIFNAKHDQGLPPGPWSPPLQSQ